MTALGIFLLSSLFFVLMGMAEFAVLLFLLRRSEPKLENLKKSNSSNDGHNVDNMFEYVDDRRIVTTGHAKTSNLPRESAKFILYSNKIDFVATILFPILYGLFNVIYWCNYMNNK